MLQFVSCLSASEGFRPIELSARGIGAVPRLVPGLPNRFSSPPSRGKRWQAAMIIDPTAIKRRSRDHRSH